eukprot:TRINITY_DN460_c0_g2_i2.p1 TRINITY_DN460_c0_g2~~TRINITY_DN460_c0_g2_i2.p1  ORF type:complete len:308 (+),score=24.83 TRINITY_DN460_c0_g2_i2:264-1187(+)
MVDSPGDEESWITHDEVSDDIMSAWQYNENDDDESTPFDDYMDNQTHTLNSLNTLSNQNSLRPYIPITCTTSQIPAQLPPLIQNNNNDSSGPLVSIPPCRPAYTVPLICTPAPMDYLGQMQSQSEPQTKQDMFMSDDDYHSVAASAVSDPTDKRGCLVLCKIENGRYVKATSDEAEDLAFALQIQLQQQKKYKKQRNKCLSSQYQYFESPSCGFHKMQYKKGGPCDYCAVTESPQWRRGPPEKPTLCNACGTRYRRTGRLELAVVRGTKRKPEQCNNNSSNNNNNRVQVNQYHLDQNQSWQEIQVMA